MRGRRTDVVEVVGAMVDAAAVGEWLSQALLQNKNASIGTVHTLTYLLTVNAHRMAGVNGVSVCVTVQRLVWRLREKQAQDAAQKLNGWFPSIRIIAKRRVE